MGPGYQRSTTHGLIPKVTKITIFDAQRYSWEHFSKSLKINGFWECLPFRPKWTRNKDIGVAFKVSEKEKIRKVSYSKKQHIQEI